MKNPRGKLSVWFRPLNLLAGYNQNHNYFKVIVLQLQPLSSTTCLISETQDGSFDTEDKVIRFLRDQGFNRPICYFHHHHQAQRYWCVNDKKTDQYLIDKGKDNSAQKKLWADAVITDRRSVVLAMRVADCFPIVISNPNQEPLALIHGGWKPLLQNIIELTLLDLRHQFNLDLKTTQVWIGPGIRACCYTSAKIPLQTRLQSWKKSVVKDKKKWRIDLPNFIQRELQRLGIDKRNIIDSQLCTGCEPNLFSHHQSATVKSKKGRFLVAVVKS